MERMQYNTTNIVFFSDYQNKNAPRPVRKQLHSPPVISYIRPVQSFLFHSDSFERRFALIEFTAKPQPEGHFFDETFRI
jgi:hypothetical protein